MTSDNTTIINNDVEVLKSISDVLNQVTENFVVYLPLIFSIFGFIGFIGNIFTYLQPQLRSNTCCIYLLCGSIIDIINLLLNLFPRYLSTTYKISIPWYISSFTCKLNLFLLIFLPHLSINFLLMAIIDRFAATCNFTSPIRQLNQFKMIPLMISITILISCLVALNTPLLYDLAYGSCKSTQPMTSSILYIILNGLTQPAVMLIFVLLTYRNVRQSRQRVKGAAGMNSRQHRTQFIVMIFAQIVSTAFFSLQWIIMFMYFTFTANIYKTNDQSSIIFFVYILSNYCYYLNNVKSFYVAIFTSNLFRKTFIKGLIELLSRHMRQRFRTAQINLPTATPIKIQRVNCHDHKI